MTIQSPPSSAHHRRIELDSPQDITYLHQLATAAAQQRLSTAFPPTTTTNTNNQPEDGDDELKSRVNELVTQFLQRTFTSVKLNCSANGILLSNTSSTSADDAASRGSQLHEQDVVAVAAEYDAIDGKIADRIRELERRREKALVRVAALRREGITRAERKWRDEWDANTLDDDDDVKVEEDEDDGGSDARSAGYKSELMDVAALRRWDDVVGAYGRGVDGLVRLKSGLAGTVGRLEEARRVGEELES